MSQISRLLEILLDGEVHTVPELLRRVYGMKKPSSARLAARIFDLRKRGFQIQSNALTGTKWFYKLILEKRLVWKEKDKEKSTKA